jgi:hypothetical protein
MISDEVDAKRRPTVPRATRARRSERAASMVVGVGEWCKQAKQAVVGPRNVRDGIGSLHLPCARPAVTPESEAAPTHPARLSPG